MAKKVESHGSPLGVHIHDTGVSVVLFEDRGGAPFFRAAREIALGNEDSKTIRERQVAALKQAHEEVAPNITTCVVSLEIFSQVKIQRFEVNPKEKERFIISEARLRAEEMLTSAPEDRIEAIDSIPGSPDRMLSVAKTQDVTAIVEICAEAGLEVVGIDTPLAAWQRTMHDDDRQHGALLDLNTSRPSLYIFANPLGQYELLSPNLSPEKLAAAIRAHFTTARMEQFSDIRHLVVTGSFGEIVPDSDPTIARPYGKDMPALLEALRTDKGLEVGYVTIGNNENPGWAFASALAGWSFGGADVLRANLLPPKKTGQVVFGIRIQPTEIIRGIATAAAVAFMVGGIAFSTNLQADGKQTELDAINSQLASMSEQTNMVGQLTADVHRLQEIARDSSWLHSSGQTAALRLAYLGNAVPDGAWIEKITHGRDGWSIEGGAKDLRTLAAVARGFEHVSPGLQTSFTTVDTQKVNGYKVLITEPIAIKPIETPAPQTSPALNSSNGTSK